MISICRRDSAKPKSLAAKSQKVRIPSPGPDSSKILEGNGGASTGRFLGNVGLKTPTILFVVLHKSADKSTTKMAQGSSFEDRSVAAQAHALAIFTQQRKSSPTQASTAPSSSYLSCQAAALAQFEQNKPTSSALTSPTSYSSSQAAALAQLE
eukprot:CAMPEP_0194042288 /NCGR_PEP_ID=MMETSP0009_2-20130614/14084_1 /TAXON_ID=210454 /ORGANISM="Grammatophora oceanica, Strain CCMP 410" /LENGTH=152 /DNA_ID=CAMNT_0038686087 /DNA_START=1 /DNA_END=456 /DNA_ORIENTATION=-